MIHYFVLVAENLFLHSLGRLLPVSFKLRHYPMPGPAAKNPEDA